MFSLLCVLHVWLAGLPASQRCLAVVSAKPATTTTTTTTNQCKLWVACEYQLSGKPLSGVRLAFPTTIRAVYWAVQALLEKLAKPGEPGSDHPAQQLVNCFTARIGHAGTNLDDIDDNQLNTLLQASRLLVLSPFEAPAELIDSRQHFGGLDLDTDDVQQYLVIFSELYRAYFSASFPIACKERIQVKLAWLIKMCINRYSLSKTVMVLQCMCITALQYSGKTQFDKLTIQQLVWLTKQSMPADHGVQLCIQRILVNRFGNELLEEAWHHGFIQAVLPDVEDRRSYHWIDYFGEHARASTHQVVRLFDNDILLQRMKLVFTALQAAQLGGLVWLLYSLCVSAQSTNLAGELCKMAIDAGMLDAVQKACACTCVGVVKVCLWLATHQPQQVSKSRLVDTMLRKAWTEGCWRDMFSMMAILLPSMDEPRKAELVRCVTVSVYQQKTGCDYRDLDQVPNLLVGCVTNNPAARKVLLETWLCKAVNYDQPGYLLHQDTAFKADWQPYVRYVHDVLAKIQLGSHPGDQAALGHLDEFFRQTNNVPVTFGTSGYVRNLDAMRERLSEQTGQSDMPAKRVCL